MNNEIALGSKRNRKQALQKSFSPQSCQTLTCVCVVYVSEKQTSKTFISMEHRSGGNLEAKLEASRTEHVSKYLCNNGLTSITLTHPKQVL
jgi:hypothetical protein